MNAPFGVVQTLVIRCAECGECGGEFGREHFEDGGGRIILEGKGWRFEKGFALCKVCGSAMVWLMRESIKDAQTKRRRGLRLVGGRR